MSKSQGKFKSLRNDLATNLRRSPTRPVVKHKKNLYSDMYQFNVTFSGDIWYLRKFEFLTVMGMHNMAAVARKLAGFNCQ